MTLNRETIFYHNISQNPEKLAIYNKAISEGKISDFDQTTLTRLRKLYYGFYSGLIYMYYEQTNTNNIANKAELLTHVLEDKDYQLVHGDTDSTRYIPFSTYGKEPLNFNSWFEVKEGQKVWVYDLFSMLRIEKSVYYKLENPNVEKIISKEFIMSNPGREPDGYREYHDGMNFMLVDILPKMESNLPKHPFKDILAPEITRFKKDIDYDNITSEVQRVVGEIDNKFIVK